MQRVVSTQPRTPFYTPTTFATPAFSQPVVSTSWIDTYLPTSNRNRLLLLIIVVVSLVIVFILWRRYLWYNPHSIIASQLGKAIPLHEEKYAASPLEYKEHVASEIMFPLVWDDDHGEYLVTMRIGKTLVAAVPDTGSSYLIVSAEICPECAREHGLYGGLSTGVTRGQKQTIHFGSQTNQIEWVTDDLWSTNQKQSIKVRLGMVEHITGTSNLNVFGLSGSRTRQDPNNFIDQTMFITKSLHAGFWFDFRAQNPTFHLGSIYTGGMGKSVRYYTPDQIKQREGTDLGKLDYYLIETTSVVVDGKTLENVPKYCMVDTGSTATIVPSTFYANIEHANTISFKFDEFVMTHNQAKHGNAMQLEPGSWLNGAPFHGHVFILGNRFMHELIMSFDLHDQTITFVDFPHNPQLALQRV